MLCTRCSHIFELSGSQPVGWDCFGSQMILSQRLHMEYPAYHIFLLQFITTEIYKWELTLQLGGSPQCEEQYLRVVALGKLRSTALNLFFIFLLICLEFHIIDPSPNHFPVIPHPTSTLEALSPQNKIFFSVLHLSHPSFT